MFLFVRSLVEGEGRRGCPGALQQHDWQLAGVSAVVPLREVTRAVCALRRRPRLDTVHAPPAIDAAVVRLLDVRKDA